MNEKIHGTEVDEPTITIKNRIYLPETLKVKAGAVVKVINNDEEEHTVTARNNQFNIEISPSNEAEFAAGTPGKFEYYCEYHPNMKGVLIIE